MRTLVLLLVVMILAVSKAVAQTAPPPAAGATPPVEAVTQIPIGTRVGEAPAGYDSGGRRDPFASLIQPRRNLSPSTVLVPRSAGLPSISVTDVRVSGILRLGTNYVAILEGPDKRSYNARPKDRLLDAVVKSVDATGVVFVEQSDPTGPGREVRKPLRRAVEDIR